MGKIGNILRAMAGSDPGPSADLVRDRAADAMRPCHVWIAGRQFPAPSASYLMALSLYKSPFINSKATELLESELPRHVIVAAYCLANRCDAIPASHQLDMETPAKWADEHLAGVDYVAACTDLLIVTTGAAHGFELFADDAQKKTTVGRKSAGGQSMGWLSRLFRRERQPA